jgi:hypothetical protein
MLSSTLPTISYPNAVLGGSVAYRPEAGDALVTIFQISTIGWTADAANFPLTFSFDYQLSAISPSLTIATSSLRAFTTTALPAGLVTEDYAIALSVTAADIYLSSASAYSKVKVTMSKNTNVTKLLAANLLSAFASGDINLAFQTVNNVASTINVVNCTGTPNCVTLNRDECLMTRATCGSCFKYHLGVVGDSNTRCNSNSTIIIGLDGTKCSKNSDCQYDNCVNGMCTAPPLACPTNDPGLICSSHGTCTYLDLSGAVRSSCSVFDNSCTAACSCSNGYGGLDCSLSVAEAIAIDSVRANLCAALVSASKLQDESSTLLATLIASLFSSFSPTEVISDKGVTVCATALTVLTSLASSGYLKGDVKTSQTLAEVISLYTTIDITTARRLSSSNASTSPTSQYPVTSAVTGLVKGVISGMASGEEPVSLVTSNVQVEVSNHVTSDVANRAFVSPATASQATYGDIQPRITLGIDGLSKCNYSGGYAQFSVLQWGKNPYAGSTAVQSALLRFSITSTLSRKISNPNPNPNPNPYPTKDPIKTPTTPTSRSLFDSITFPLPKFPAYFVSLQFMAIQDFNFTASSSLSRYSKNMKIYSNFSLPACTLYNGMAYVPCHGCNISSFTNYNVTYSCYDITQLCPKTPAQVSVKRFLLEGNEEIASG